MKRSLKVEKAHLCCYHGYWKANGMRRIFVSAEKPRPTTQRPMVCTVSTGRAAPKPMVRVVSMVPAGRTPRRLCDQRGCYDARTWVGTCRWRCGGLERAGTLAALSERQSLARFLRLPRFPPRPRGGKSLLCVPFQRPRSLPLLSAVWPETGGEPRLALPL